MNQQISSGRGGNPFLRASIGQKIMGTFLLVLVFAVANIAVVKTHLDDFNGMATTVNIAGKLRWLSQRLAAQAVGLTVGATNGLARIQQDMHSVERNLQLLKLGGIVVDQEIRGLSPVHQSPLDEVTDAWLAYKADLEQAISAYQSGNPTQQNALMMSGSMRMLHQADALMTSIVLESQRKQRQTLRSMYTLLLADAVALLAIFILSHKYMVRPLRELAEQSRQLIAGNYDARVDYQSSDEIGRLALSLNRSAEQIGQLITDLESEQEQIQESSAMFMGLAANTMVGIYIVQNNSFHFLNEKMAVMLGYESAAQITDGNAMDIFMPEDRAKIQDSMQRRLKGEEAEAYFERRVVRQDNRVLFLGFFSSVVNLGGVPSLMGVALDITQRKEAEASLRLASLVYESSSEGMVVTDEDTVIVTVNPAFTAITGYTRDDVVGQKINILSSGRQDKEFYKKMWRSIISTGKWDGDIWNRRKNGEEYAERLSITTSYKEDGGVRFRIALFSDITKKKQSDALIWKQANYDHLTGLANRQLFHDRLQQAIARSDRSRLPAALVFLDLDFFKEINDTLGHDKGDELLKQVATRLTTGLRATDTIARLGGDEFIMIMGEITDFKAVSRMCQSLLDALAAPYLLGNDVANISASMGVSFYPQDAEVPLELLKNADLAMYAAKEKGRNQFALFTDEMRESAKSRGQLSRDLVAALAADQFVLYYQPIVDLSTGQIHKAEALIRWIHPEYGLIPPGDFIPFAEDTGLIVNVGDWVFREAARQVAEWRRKYQDNFQIGLNVSPLQFMADGLDYQEWLQHLRDLDLPGSSITVEITERLLMNVDDETTTRLLAFRDAGVQVALDDFGTGYSSLSYLKKFDIDTIKIDQSFVRNLAPGSDDCALCEAIIVMAHRLGLKVVAEGIETPDQYRLLAEAGCDYGQGYIFARPLPADEFAELLKRGKNQSDGNTQNILEHS